MQTPLKPIVILSFDGLATQDLEFLKLLPGFEAFLREASGCKSVESIYPSLTYPAHATIVTGCYPKTHGIVDNTLRSSKRPDPDWYWQHSHFRVPTLYDLAGDLGYKVAALLWPTTAKSKIALNMPEIFANRPLDHQILVSLRNGTVGFQIKMNHRYGSLRKGKQQPQLDHFTHRVLMDVLKDEKPNCVLCHFTDLDSMRHEHGFESDEARDALKRHDKRLLEVMAYLNEEHFYREATVVVLGDHASIDAQSVLSINAFLKDLGWWTPVKASKSKRWAYGKTCDGSAYIYCSPLTAEDKAVLRGNLEQFAQYTQGVEAVYDQPSLIEKGADPEAVFMLEAKKGYVFAPQTDTPYLLALENHPAFLGQRITAVHGHDPLKADYQTVFMVKGPRVEPGVWLERMVLTDVAPTMALFMGIHLKEAEGRARHQFLRKEDQ